MSRINHLFPLAPLALCVCGALGLGCSHTLPPELANARTSYAHAARSPGAQLVPGDIADARAALNMAEREFSNSGGDQTTRDLAYVADRRSVSAAAKASTAMALQQKQVALADLEQTRRMHAARQAVELERSRTQVTQAQQEAESERQARVASEQALLSKIKDLKAEVSARGLIVTISGSVLFATGKSVLLPSAQQRLAAVADAFKDDKRQIMIVGHTDSTGKPETNQLLSQQRAEAVKKFLVEHGMTDNQIRTMGMGESQPITSNATPDGRANNRRVEIVLQNEPGQSPGQSSQQNQKGKGGPPTEEKGPMKRP
jgi:outer membrane protein OmpA-like peptidoglycan-associated protein